MSFIPRREGVVSTLNSTSTPLAGNANFTGPGEDVSQYATVTVVVLANTVSATNGLSLQFSSDSLNWDNIQLHDVPAGANRYYVVAVKGRYFRLSYKNGASGQGFFRLQTLYHLTKTVLTERRLDDGIQLDDVATLSRSVLMGQKDNGAYANAGVSQQGDLTVQVRSPITAFHEIATAQRVPIEQLSFEYNINLSRVKTAITGSGSVTQGLGEAIISTGPGMAAASSGSLESIRVVRLRPGQGVTNVFSARFTQGVVGSEQLGGLGNPTDGFYFGYDGATFGILFFEGGVKRWVPQTSWNIDVMDGAGSSQMTLDPTKGNIYSIQLQQSFGADFFGILDQRTGRFVPVHFDANINVSIIADTIKPVFPIQFSATNTTNATDIAVYTPAAAVFNEGQVVLTGPKFSASNELIGVGTALTNLLTIRNKTTFQGVANRVPIKLILTSYGFDATKPFFAELWANATLGGTPVWNDIDTNGSVVEFDIAGTTVTGGKNISIFLADGVGSDTIDLSSLDLFINPGNTVTLAVRASQNTGDAIGSLAWQEDN